MQEFCYFCFFKSNNTACGTYTMAGGAVASSRINCTKSIGNTTQSNKLYDITQSAKVLDRHAKAYILTGKQTHRTPRQQGQEPKLGLMREAICTRYPELSPYCNSADNTWLTAGIRRAMPAPQELPSDRLCSLPSTIGDQPDKRKRLPRNNKGDPPQHIPPAGAPPSRQRSKRDRITTEIRGKTQGIQ